MKVLVTGASGYVGSRLVPRLLDEDHEVRASTTDLSREMPWWSADVDAVEMDALDADQVRDAVEGMDAVYYLVHGMAGDDFAEKDLRAARIMSAAAAEAGVGRIVYLSGIVPDVPRAELSEHIESRLSVESALADGGTTVISLRAAILVGSGSTSFEIIRQVSERLPVQTIPAWMDSEVQPIAVVDAVEALIGALVVETGTRHYDVGGPIRLRYAELLDAYSELTGLTRPQVTVPLVPDTVVGQLAGRLIDVPASIVGALVKSLHHDMVAADEDFLALLPDGYRLMPVEEAIRRSLAPRTQGPARADPMGPMPQDPDWADGGSERSKVGRAIDAVTDLLPGDKGETGEKGED